MQMGKNAFTGKSGLAINNTYSDFNSVLLFERTTYQSIVDISTGKENETFVIKIILLKLNLRNMQRHERKTCISLVLVLFFSLKYANILNLLWGKWSLKYFVYMYLHRFNINLYNVF